MLWYTFLFVLFPFSHKMLSCRENIKDRNRDANLYEKSTLTQNKEYILKRDKHQVKHSHTNKQYNAHKQYTNKYNFAFYAQLTRAVISGQIHIHKYASNHKCPGKSYITSCSQPKCTPYPFPSPPPPHPQKAEIIYIYGYELNEYNVCLLQDMNITCAFCGT